VSDLPERLAREAIETTRAAQMAAINSSAPTVPDLEAIYAAGVATAIRAALTEAAETARSFADQARHHANAARVDTALMIAAAIEAL